MSKNRWHRRLAVWDRWLTYASAASFIGIGVWLVIRIATDVFGVPMPRTFDLAGSALGLAVICGLALSTIAGLLGRLTR